MNLKESDKLFAIRCTLAAALLAVSAPVYIDPDNAIRVKKALLGNPVDCGNGIEAQNKDYPFDAIVVPGAGRVKKADGTFEPNYTQKIRLEAAAFAYSKRFAPLIILLNGKREEGESEGKKYLENRVEELTEGTAIIPDKRILTEENSINTATNMEELVKIAKKRNLKKVLIVTNKNHLARATLLACANGVAASSKSAEELLVEQNSGHANIISDSSSEQAKELAEVVLIAWDPKGKFPTWVKRLLHNR
ncbi:MAG: YdcF family protein [Candidatus Levyibacteriota bacterium]